MFGVGSSQLRIDVYDHDTVFSDDLIGSTCIDLEDRWFSPSWQQLKKKPLEHRPLYRMKNGPAQGTLEVWLDILSSAEARTNPICRIAPSPPEKFELRLIIWKTENVAAHDGITNQNDLFVRAKLQRSGFATVTLETDTHYRAKKGVGNFNWRMKFPIELPRPRNEAPRLLLQLWDRDLIESNDCIAELDLDLGCLCRPALQHNPAGQRHAQLVKGSKQKLWFRNLMHPSKAKPQVRIRSAVPYCVMWGYHAMLL